MSENLTDDCTRMVSHLTALFTKPLSRQLLGFLLVMVLHSAVVVVMFWPAAPVADVVEPPALQGVLVQHVTAQETVPEPVVDIPVPPPVEPEPPKPEPKPAKKTPVKLPESDKGTVAPSNVTEPVVEPAPPAEIVEPKKTTMPPEPMPAKPKPAAAPVKMPDAHAGHLQNPAPVYPMLSRKRKEQGTVILRLLVRADGTVSDITIHQSSGFSRLDDSAVHAVKRWHYTPAVQEGKAIDYWHFQPVVFSIN